MQKSDTSHFAGFTQRRERGMFAARDDFRRAGGERLDVIRARRIEIVPHCFKELSIFGFLRLPRRRQPAADLGHLGIVERSRFDEDAMREIVPYVRDGSQIVQSVAADEPDRKSTRLNSSHLVISYAVFCLKKT